MKVYHFFPGEHIYEYETCDVYHGYDGSEYFLDDKRINMFTNETEFGDYDTLPCPAVFAFYEDAFAAWMECEREVIEALTREINDRVKFMQELAQNE